MNCMQSKRVARLMLAALALSIASVPVEAGGARLEGYLVGADGRAAAGYRVHLIDGEGRDVEQSETSDEGVYRFRDLASGAYSLGIESPDGRMAPVAAPPVRLDADELARRDIKLVEASADQQAAVGRENKGFGFWWAGLPPEAKAGAVIGTFVALGLGMQALDDDSEDRGSPILPD
jgi:hypothetical protein